MLIKVDEEQKWKKNSKRFVCGSLAGITATVFTHPIDVVRSRMAYSRSNSPVKRSLVKFVKGTIRNEGYGVFTHGLTPSIIVRAAA
jgi:hypothetical protein